jgi:hypothetical protein
VHPFGLRHVLQHLDEVVAIDDLGRRAGEIAADLERSGVDLPRTAVVVQQIVDEIAPSVDQAAPTGLQGALEHRRVGRREVGGGHGVLQERHRQLGLAGLHPVQVGDLQQVDAVLPPGQVRLPQTPERRILLPGRVGEPLVARVHRHRALGGAAGEPVQRGGARIPQPFAELQRQRRGRQRALGRRAGGGRQRPAEQCRVVVLEQRGLRRERLRGLRGLVLRRVWCGHDAGP